MGVSAVGLGLLAFVIVNDNPLMAVALACLVLFLGAQIAMKLHTCAVVTNSVMSTHRQGLHGALLYRSKDCRRYDSRISQRQSILSDGPPMHSEQQAVLDTALWLDVQSAQALSQMQHI